MADEAQASERWLRESDDVHSPAARQVVSVRETLRVSVLGFGIASALALIPWFADLGPVLGMCALGVPPSRQHRHLRSALAAFVLVGLTAAIGTGLIAHALPHPWEELLPAGLGVMAGSVAYAWVTGARPEAQRSSR